LTELPNAKCLCPWDWWHSFLRGICHSSRCSRRCSLYWTIQVFPAQDYQLVTNW